MKVVIDPNVLVSAAVASGASSQLIDRWLTERPFELIVCPMLIDELRDVLARDKYRRWLTRQDAQRFVDRLDTEADNRPDPTEILPSLTIPETTTSWRSTATTAPTCFSPATATSWISPPRMSPSSRPRPGLSRTIDIARPDAAETPIGIGGSNLYGI